VFQRAERARSRAVRAGALLGSALCSSACTNDTDTLALSELAQPILRGSIADPTELNHTGALVVVDRASRERTWFCTGTLIAPESVVTAKHCTGTILGAEARGLDVAWLAGPSVAAPVEIIPIVALELTPRSRSGFLGIGRDVAVAHLEQPTSIPPVQPLPLSDAQLGQTLLEIGYGVFRADAKDGGEDGVRRSGNATLAALHGSIYPAMFGSFESYVEWSFTADATDFDYLSVFTPDTDPLDELVLESLLEDFDSAPLLDGYEAVAGGRQPGDVQSCVGDSGGPLALRAADGSWQTYGVVSGSLYSTSSSCDFGTVFATFGPDSLAFLRNAQAWQDPCGDVPAEGECRGGAAVQCATSLFDDRRELLTRDCGESAQDCFLGPNGAECHEPLPHSDEPDAGTVRESDAGNVLDRDAGIDCPQLPGPHAGNATGSTLKGARGGWARGSRAERIGAGGPGAGLRWHP